MKRFFAIAQNDKSDRLLLITERANRLASFFLRRVLPRKVAVRIMGQNTRKMYGD